MVAIQIASLLLSAGTLVSAAPASLDARGSCTFTDAATVLKNKASCTDIVIKNMFVPAGTTLDLTGLKSGTTVTFQGTTTFGYKEWLGPLISVSGNNLKIIGDSGHVLNGNGTQWYDGKGSNGGKKKPAFFSANALTSSSITGLNVKNTPVRAFSISSSRDLTLDHITIDNSDGDGANGGHNTDGFDVGTSTGVYITNANVTNQDDCLAVNSGTDIHFTGGTCSHGHGISIGSVGHGAVVKNVVISDSTVIDSENGIRIKTIAGATGSVSGITYKDITLKNISKYGIVIRQDYKNGNPTGAPTTGVPITDVTLQNIKGTVGPRGTPIFILCGRSSCNNFKWSGISITGGQKSTSSLNVPEGAFL